MKRTISTILALILLTAVFPHAALGETVQSHIIEADRVLIYNPLPYDAKKNTLFSGTIQKSGEDTEPTGDPLYTSGMHITGKDYSTAKKDPDMRDFWVCTDLVTYRYDKRTFRLAAEGEHCCIWVMEGDTLAFTDEQTAAMLDQFETVIYPSDTANFGGFRDLAGNGKLMIVTYAMNSNSVCGFFDSYDLYTREEIEQIDPDDADSYNYLPIINVNSRMADRTNVVYGTLAHEFQHLILRSAVLASPANAGRLGEETAPGVWLNEGFAMAAEEFAYPGSVAEQGYLEAYERSEKVRQGMSVMNFDATGSDVGAYGQSFLFTEYLRTQCGDDVFRNILIYWREAESVSELTEAKAICTQLEAPVAEALDAICIYKESTASRIGEHEDVLLSKLLLAFYIAIQLQNDNGVFSVGSVSVQMPAYEGTGRKIEGGGALLIECSGSFAVPPDADSGLVFIGIYDGAVTEIYTVPEPEEGFYVIAAQYNGEWLAIPASPAENRILKPVKVRPNEDGTIRAADAKGAIFRAEHREDGFAFTCDDANGEYLLSRTGTTSNNLCIKEKEGVFTWTHFADGSDKLQSDGFYGRAILYGAYQNGFGYYAPAYFENTSFAKPRLLRVTMVKGDANLDGRITAGDAALMLRTVVGLSYMNDAMRTAGDLDGDGIITATDAAIALRIVIQLDS